MNTTEEFEEVCLPHYAQVQGLCRRMLGPQRAADAAQETFTRALGKFHMLQERPAARGWLLSIATHHCYDLLRARVEAELNDKDRDIPAADNDLTTPLVSDAILTALSPRPRSLLVLRHYLQLSYAEIAQVLQIPADQVGVALQRARADALKCARQKGLTHGL